MKTLLTLLLSLALTASAIDYGPLEVEGFIQAAGKKQMMDGKEYLTVEIPTAVWKEINTGRRLTGRASYSQEVVRATPMYAREYLADWVNLVKSDLIAVLKREPSREELFVGWHLGLPKFKKMGYSVAKLPEDVELRLKVFLSVKVDRSAINVNEPPPPLPTDGRRPVARVYAEDERRRFK